MVGSYPMFESTEGTKVCGPGPEEAMSYAGVGIPSFAKDDDVVWYLTYIEYPEAWCVVAVCSSEKRGWTMVAGMILAWMSELSMVSVRCTCMVGMFDVEWAAG